MARGEPLAALAVLRCFPDRVTGGKAGTHRVREDAAKADDNLAHHSRRAAFAMELVAEILDTCGREIGQPLRAEKRLDVVFYLLLVSDDRRPLQPIVHRLVEPPAGGLADGDADARWSVDAFLLLGLHLDTPSGRLAFAWKGFEVLLAFVRVGNNPSGLLACLCAPRAFTYRGHG